MNIGLVDVDGHNFPNLAIGKIAAYHRSIGDSVEWASPLFGNYDRVYASKVFTFTPDFTDYYDCEVVKGGTGYDIYTDTIRGHVYMHVYEGGIIHAPDCPCREKDNHVKLD